jgi:acyl carrier protein
VTLDSVFDYGQFAEYLGEGLRLDSAILTPDARLIEDLGLDSLYLLELLVLVEELGVHLPDYVAVAMETVGDVYREYADRATRLRARSAP